MDWKIAEAKQRFSEVVKFCVQEPQMIYNRREPVAALIAADEYARYQAWKAEQTRPRSMAEEFAELRKLLVDHDLDPLPDPDRANSGRPNAFDQMLEEEYDPVHKA